MVAETITDGERIATILRAEIENRETAGAGSLAIRERGGTEAVVADGTTVAELDPCEAGLDLYWLAEHGRLDSAEEHPGFTVRRIDDRPVLTIETGAAVKRVLDLLSEG